MAATDQKYRNQKKLDIVFAVSGVLTFISLVFMFAVDYLKPWKEEQKVERGVASVHAQREAFRALFGFRIGDNRLQDILQRYREGNDKERDKAREDFKVYIGNFTSAEAALAKANEAVKSFENNKEYEAKINSIMVPKQSADATSQNIKADYDSKMSLWFIAIDETDRAAKYPALAEYLSGNADRLDKELTELQPKLSKAQIESDDLKAKLQAAQAEKTKAENDQSAAQDRLKRLRGDYDRFHKLSLAKQWTMGDTIRALPIIDGFASPVRIQQITIDDLTIDYHFKQIPRNDRCTTCHVGIDRNNYGKKAVNSLRNWDDDLQDNLDTFRELLAEVDPNKASGFDPKDLPTDIPSIGSRTLTAAGWKSLSTSTAVPDVPAWAQGKPPLETESPTQFAERLLDEKYPKDNYPKDAGSEFEKIKKWAEVLAKLKSLVEKSFETKKAFRSELGKVLKEDADTYENLVLGYLTPVGPLTDARVTEFCAHPRMDLFVGDKSPHPMQKFGCTACHGGKGGATEFDRAAHTPSNIQQTDEWVKTHGWEREADWEYPMYPTRFQESACLKCHHQVTDLIRNGNQYEAPKLLRGYNLVTELGCFGCHEIAGFKNGRPIGPDLRLEPSPPVDKLTALEQMKLLENPMDPPGNQRKVGPSLRRLSEKTNLDWVARWISDPRGFRPDTRMPHFYNIPNNNTEEALKDTEKDFPNAEKVSIASYLIHESQDYLKGEDHYLKDTTAKKKELEDRVKKVKELQEKRQSGDKLTAEEEATLEKDRLSAQESRELDDLTHRFEFAKSEARVPLGKAPGPLHIVDEDGNVHTKLPDRVGSAAEQETRGRQLFTERGCLACHTHEGTTVASAQTPAVTSKAIFAPNLTRLAAKLGNGEPESARIWLVQWILNPNIHSPRTKMPITHLKIEEANDLATWLLSQKDDAKTSVPTTTPQALEKLARLHLLKAPVLTRDEVDKLLVLQTDGKRVGLDDKKIASLPLDSDERELKGPLTEERFKWYIGKKTISRLGCFGCHEIPGFETAKPIGTPLNDWGKKDPARLAFEDIVAYVNKHDTRVANLDAEQDVHGKAVSLEEGKKKPFEEYFYQALVNEQREGFLYQKLRSPRSYDYHRDRTWDDRLRMPQFKFAHVSSAPPPRNESDEDAQERLRAQFKAEAEAREAVMTFVLGLTADQVPLKYVNKPSPDRLAEAKGRQILDKFNCAGCHQVQPGIYQFQRSNDVLKDLVKKLDGRKPGVPEPGDYPLPNHNAYVGQPSPYPDRIMVYAVPPVNPEASDKEKPAAIDRSKPVSVWLTQAVRFNVSPGELESVTPGVYETPGVYDIPAGQTIRLKGEFLLPGEAEPYGGDFVRLLVPYLLDKNVKTRFPNLQGDRGWSQAALPPPLLREGERVRPAWLSQFLLNPTIVRPPQKDGGLMILRMPKFNMSPTEAAILVDYFAANDRRANPGESLNYPYPKLVEQRLREFWQKQNKDYVARLDKDKKLDAQADLMLPVYRQYLQERIIPEMPRRLKDLEENVRKAEEAYKKTPTDSLKKDLEDAQKELKATQKESDEYKKLVEDKKSKFPSLTEQWKENDAYATDAFRLIASPTPQCIQCHKIGDVGSSRKAPSLDLATEPLRPGWTKYWLANPARLTTFQHPMPPLFPNDRKKQEGYEKLFDGEPLDRLNAVRNILMNYIRMRPTNPPPATS